MNMSFLDNVRVLAASSLDMQDALGFYLTAYDKEESVQGKQELIKEIHNYIRELGLDDDLLTS